MQITALTLALLGVTFVADVWMPAEIPVGPVYAALLLLMLWEPRPNRVMLMASVATGLLLLELIISDPLPVRGLRLVNAGAGIAGATISTAQAVIADSTRPEERRGGMALIGAAFGIGFTFGPLLGAGAMYFAPETPWATGALASALSLAAFAFASVGLPETRVPGGHSADRKIFDARASMAVLSNPSVGPVILINFLATIGFAGFESTLALLNRDFLGFEERNNFLVFTFVGFVLALVNGAYRGMAKRMSEIPTIAAGIVLMGTGVAGLSLVTMIEVRS